MTDNREGNLAPAQREPVPWQSAEYYDPAALNNELERVFDICHGCRRCVSLCESFPTLFDLVDESDTMEVDGIDPVDYHKVVDECFLCDLCAETKCPYLPPHAWAVDFPHLMLRAKAQKFEAKQSKFRDRIIAKTDQLLPLLSNPVVAPIANAANRSRGIRKLGSKLLGIHELAPLPQFANRSSKHLVRNRQSPQSDHKIAIYNTCYGDAVAPKTIEALVKVLTHNKIEFKLLCDTGCCGVPKLELGDLVGVSRAKEKNIPQFVDVANAGFLIMAIVPSCLWMYRMEIPLLFPDDQDVLTVKAAIVSPFEYLLMLHQDGKLKTNFRNPLGKVTYHAACHQRTQNIGPKTRELLSLIPGTQVTQIERCSGHDGSYAWRSESYEKATKISRPVVRKVQSTQPDTWGSDCPMAATLITQGLEDHTASEHPIEMVARAYGL